MMLRDAQVTRNDEGLYTVNFGFRGWRPPLTVAFTYQENRKNNYELFYGKRLNYFIESYREKIYMPFDYAKWYIKNNDINYSIDNFRDFLINALLITSYYYDFLRISCGENLYLNFIGRLPSIKCLNIIKIFPNKDVSDYLIHINFKNNNLWPTLSFNIKNNLVKEFVNKNYNNESIIDRHIEDSFFKYLITQRKVLSLSQRRALAGAIRKALDKSMQSLAEENKNNVCSYLHEGCAQ